MKPTVMKPVEVYTNLYVSSMEERFYDAFTLFACKTGHKLVVGATPTKDHPHHLSYFGRVASSLNLIDVMDPSFYEGVGVAGINRAMTWLDDRLWDEERVQIVCDQGRTRSAGIAALYIATRGEHRILPSEAYANFIALYPAWIPGGIWDWMCAHWDEFAWSEA